MRPWYLGNTTVRSPFRLRDGLVALASSSLQGRIYDREQEDPFARLLDENGVINIVDQSIDVSSTGRKWRAALSQLGFIVPKLKRDQHLLGEPSTLTTNGRRLIEATTVPGMQECFLRLLAAYYIPSMQETGYERDYHQVFSPLRHTLGVMLELERRTGENYLGFLEMALIVQLTSSGDELTVVADRILELRNNRDPAVNKRRFDGQAKSEAAAEHGYVTGTFGDYADTNFRYLKATGLVHSSGRGLSIVPEKHLFVEQLVADQSVPDTYNISYLITLCNGASLPTDNLETARLVLEDLIGQARNRSIDIGEEGRILDNVADIDVFRHTIEQLLFENNEEEYADGQAEVWEEITGYMELILTGRKSMTLNTGEEIKVPQGEAPAYFEWILWRAFLAINSLLNKPYNSRRFKIDQDFLPIGPAPGNGPDLLFEFDDFVVVVEVTLTDNSRQEAAEGEPVRRHVADIACDYMEQYGKPTYGLFIANRIDTNTAETFRIGVWYTSDDNRMQLDIIPLTLERFKSLFEALFRSDQVEVHHIRRLLDDCGSLRNLEAPIWKAEIDQTVSEIIEEIMS